MLLLMDLVVYLWYVPNPNVFFAFLKKSYINSLVGFKFFQLLIFLNYISSLIVYILFYGFVFVFNLKEMCEFA